MGLNIGTIALDVLAADPSDPSEGAIWYNSTTNRLKFQTSLGTRVLDGLLCNYSAVVDPNVTDDASDGYSVGSVWLNTLTDVVFVCCDSTAGAAVWSCVSKTNLRVAEASTSTTTTSTSTVLMNGMTLTPPAGIYQVTFSGDLSHSASGASIYTSIYSGGYIVPASERTYTRASVGMATSFFSMAKVAVNGYQAIEGRWRTTANTATNYHRQLYVSPTL